MDFKTELFPILSVEFWQDFRFPGGSEVKNPPASAGNAGLIPESGQSPGEGDGNPLLYFCLGNPTHGVAKESDTA